MQGAGCRVWGVGCVHQAPVFRSGSEPRRDTLEGLQRLQPESKGQNLASGQSLALTVLYVCVHQEPPFRFFFVKVLTDFFWEIYYKLIHFC